MRAVPVPGSTLVGMVRVRYPKRMAGGRRRRAWVRVLRALLWPIARLRPQSGWARIERRLAALEDTRNAPIVERLRSPKLLLAILLVGAAAVWLYDAIRSMR